MENSTQIMSFVLTAYGNVGHLRYLYFTIVSVLYISIVFANAFLIMVICAEKRLHEPMYLFLCSLFANELYGSTALFPCLMTQLFLNTHEVSVICCFIQIFCLYTYASVEYCNLAVMSYDRYVSICYPLQYNIIMTPSRVCMIIVFVWIYCFVKFTITLSLSIPLRLCGNTIDKVYCDNYLVVKLACSGTTVNNIYGLFGIVLSVAVPLIPILFSYIKILNVCLKASSETKQKAVSTCSPHIASLINFSFGCFFEVLQSRFDLTHVPGALRIILSVYFLMCQPLFNPIMYGLKMTKIRNVCYNLLQRKIYHLHIKPITT